MPTTELKVLKNQSDKKTEMEISVEAPVKYSQKAYSMALKDFANSIDFPGFRKGKVPKEIIEKKFGANAIIQHAFEKIFSEVMVDVIEQEKLDIVDVLEVKSYELIPDKALCFKVLVELKPEVKLGKYKKVKVKVKRIKYDAELFIKKTLERVAENFISFNHVQNKGANEGDLLTLDFEGSFEDGKPVPGGKAENFQALLQKDKFLPEFVEQLKGVKEGDSKEITLTFPENYGTDFSGKKANFKVKVLKVEERVLPEINDDLAKKAGIENLKDLKEKILIQKNFIEVSNSQRDFENALVDEIIKNSKFEISSRMVDKEIDYLLADMKKNLEKSGTNWENFKKDSKNKDLLEKAKEAANKRIAIDLVLTSLIKGETITATKEEVDLEVNNRLTQLGKNYEHLAKDSKFLNVTQFIVLRNKAVDFLVKNNEAEWEDVVSTDIPG